MFLVLRLCRRPKMYHFEVSTKLSRSVYLVWHNRHTRYQKRRDRERLPKRSGSRLPRTLPDRTLPSPPSQSMCQLKLGGQNSSLYCALLPPFQKRIFTIGSHNVGGEKSRQCASGQPQPSCSTEQHPPTASSTPPHACNDRRCFNLRRCQRCLCAHASVSQAAEAPSRSSTATTQPTPHARWEDPLLPPGQSGRVAVRRDKQWRRHQREGHA